MNIEKLILLLSLLAVACQVPQSNDKKLLINDTLKFELKGNTIYIPAVVENTDSVIFILDNEAPYSFFNKDYFVNILDSFKNFILIRSLDTNTFIYKGKIDVKIHNTSISLDTVAFGILPKFCKYGFLGTGFFINKIISLNFIDSILYISNTLPDTSNYEKIPLHKTSSSLSLRWIELEFKNNDNQKIVANFGIDLGAPYTFFTTNFFNKIDIGKINIDTTSKSLREQLNHIILRYKNEKIPTINDNLDDFNIQLDGVIGIAFLKKFDCILDYKNNNLYIRPNNRFKP